MDGLSKFLCDHMLIRLGRWLRAAGYDTAIADGMMSDSLIFEQAVREGRVLITRDRAFYSKKGETNLEVIILVSNSVEGCARELTQDKGIDWNLKPFSRCLLCNNHLVPADSKLKDRLPADIRLESKAWYCPTCDKLYWEGSHTRRMRQWLDLWNER